MNTVKALGTWAVVIAMIVVANHFVATAWHTPSPSPPSPLPPGIEAKLDRLDTGLTALSDAYKGMDARVGKLEQEIPPSPSPQGAGDVPMRNAARAYVSAFSKTLRDRAVRVNDSGWDYNTDLKALKALHAANAKAAADRYVSVVLPLVDSHGVPLNPAEYAARIKQLADGWDLGIADAAKEMAP